MHESPQEHRPWFRSRSGLVLLAFLGIAGFFLVTEHRAHVFGALLYLLLLECPLMHSFIVATRVAWPPRRTATNRRG